MTGETNVAAMDQDGSGPGTGGGSGRAEVAVVRGRRATGRRCLAAGCGRPVHSGRALCGEHARSAAGRELAEAVRRLTQRMEQGIREGERHTRGARRRREGFRRRLARGEYGQLFDGPVREVMAQAAAERRLADEIGALRVALAKLLAEEDDALRLATGVVRVAGATVRVMRAQRELEASGGSELQRAMLQVLAELDGEAPVPLPASTAPPIGEGVAESGDAFVDAFDDCERRAAR